MYIIKEGQQYTGYTLGSELGGERSVICMLAKIHIHGKGMLCVVGRIIDI